MPVTLWTSDWVGLHSFSLFSTEWPFPAPRRVREEEHPSVTRLREDTLRVDVEAPMSTCTLGLMLSLSGIFAISSQKTRMWSTERTYVHVCDWQGILVEHTAVLSYLLYSQEEDDVPLPTLPWPGVTPCGRNRFTSTLTSGLAMRLTFKWNVCEFQREVLQLLHGSAILLSPWSPELPMPSAEVPETRTAEPRLPNTWVRSELCLGHWTLGVSSHSIT